MDKDEAKTISPAPTNRGFFSVNKREEIGILRCRKYLSRLPQMSVVLEKALSSIFVPY